MAVRITQTILVDRVLRDLNVQSRRLLTLQEQLSTGQVVNKPSDDPLAARRAIAARIETGQNDQYLTNISTAKPIFRETEASLLTVNQFLQRANELALQGSNSVNGSGQLDQIAEEVNQIIEGVLQQSNANSNNRYLFAGTRTLTEPFEATRDANGRITAVQYTGNDESISIAISEQVRVPTNISGQDAFEGPINIFDTLIQLRDNLEAGDPAGLELRLGEVQQAAEQILLSTARIGAIENRLDQSEANLDEINVQLQEVISDNLDADFAEVAVQLNASLNAYQAALNSSARVIQPSLLDFIG
jgi:flagellar hook-associated protein 3 FlgL